jgi:hypothetical protein
LASASEDETIKLWNLKTGESIDFQAFCKLFMETPVPDMLYSARPHSGKIGALWQVYQENGSVRAVLNGLFPGGGKLFSRWLHLFPADFKESLEAWNEAETLYFPWHAWSNANFQNLRSRQHIAVPAGRAVAGSSLNLSELAVRLEEDGPKLVEKSSGRILECVDLGLEAPETKPPAMQILWHLCVPYVSNHVLWPTETPWQVHSADVNVRPRMEQGPLVWARKAWDVSAAYWEITGENDEKHHLMVQKLQALGIPNLFFARMQAGREKPQFFDQAGAISMLRFEKLLKAAAGQRLFIEEMLPVPEQWVIGDTEKYAAEFVLEVNSPQRYRSFTAFFIHHRGAQRSTEQLKKYSVRLCAPLW